MRVGGEQIVEALAAEGLDAELGYPGPIPLYLYPMIKDKITFGSSGWPFNSPATDTQWEYAPGLCPEAENACQQTVIVPWNEGLRSRHVELMAKAISKVIDAYRR